MAASGLGLSLSEAEVLACEVLVEVDLGLCFADKGLSFVTPVPAGLVGCRHV